MLIAAAPIIGGLVIKILRSRTQKTTAAPTEPADQPQVVAVMVEGEATAR